MNYCPCSSGPKGIEMMNEAYILDCVNILVFSFLLKEMDTAILFLWLDWNLQRGRFLPTWQGLGKY